jgi:hypothetical protein
VTLELECLDRVCFNAHRPELQSPRPYSCSAMFTPVRGGVPHQK